MNIYVSGLTAAGKSFAARRVADDLRWEMIAGSAIRASVYGLDSDIINAKDFWQFDATAAKLDRRRIRSPATDKDVEDTILRLALEPQPRVFDVWFAGWFAPPDSLTVWIQAPLQVRAQRLAKATDRDMPSVIAAIKMKDMRAAKFCAGAYGIDLVADRSPFNLVIDVERLDRSIQPDEVIHNAAYHTWGDAIAAPWTELSLTALDGVEWRSVPKEA